MEQSGYLHTPHAALAAHAAWSTNAPARGLVLLFPPLFEERKSCAVAMAQLARALADAGFASLRFDPRGTGDSSGTLEEARVEDWLEDGIQARNRLREAGLPVILLGIRFGALLAVAVHEAAAAEALALWEPVASGTDLLRQAVQRKLVNDMAAFGSSAYSRASLDASWQRGETVDLDGYRISAGLHEGLLRLAPAPVDRGVPALVVSSRTGRRVEEAVSGLCPGAERLLCPTPPFWSLVGIAEVSGAVRTIVEELRERFPERPGGSPAKWPPGLATAWEHETQIAVPAPGDRVLRAVWHGPDSAAPRLRVLCLSGWSGCRLGPHNVWVALARRLAEQGVATLRLDFAGRGDSPGDPKAATIAGMTEDARAAIAWIRAQEDPDTPLAVVAICSGCKVALATASEEPGISRMVLWSPEPMGSLRPAGTNRRKALSVLRTYLLKLGRRENWNKLLRGRVRGTMVRKAILQQETRGQDEARNEDAVLERFRGYRGRLLAVFGGGDPEATGSETAYAAFCSRHGIPLERHRIPHAGHSFYHSDWARELLERTCAGLLSD